jgi:protein-S-isoprenylcysteine O-methyltransferase Ste14
MFVLARAVTWATLFIALVLVLLPSRIVSWSGIARPAALGPAEIGGVVIALAGAVLAIWCVLTFAVVGKGTPAPFDPPRRLVVRGPYRFVRNPMYIGALLVLTGAAIVYHSAAILGYIVLFGTATSLFVIYYEEPTLRRTFGVDYETYCAKVHRWLPSVKRS